VVRVRDAEQLSLAALADRIGVSKARANRFVQLGSTEEPQHG